ncbi:unnamed protein product [Caretta caretta]
MLETSILWLMAHSSAVQRAPFSNHHLVTIMVSLHAERPGPAYWHFNNSLLEDESFVLSFREFWLAWREQWRAFPSVQLWWDLGKVSAKLFCHDYTRDTSRRRNAVIEQLEREVLEMERRLAANPEDPSLCGACREKWEELRALEDHRARGAFVPSRIRLLREMDRGSRFFYALEKMRGAKKHVTCLLAEDGTPLTDLEEMCGRARDFYTSLFSPDPTDPGACGVLWEELPTVSVGDRDRLELPLSLAEFSEALRRMPTNKSPGMDGLTVEFYRAFWDILCPDLVIVWAESLQSGVLPLSCRRAVLALLPRKGDLCDLRNWRPVSLLSTDYKIVAKAISLRLGSVMADVIHPDQTYIVPGRSIFDNLFLVRDLLELGRRDGLSFALLSLDQEKAFDRVDYGYLLSTLQAFGFGPQFVSFLRVLYASAECLVRLNWTLTEPVSFGRGVRQGCPLSGQLYALAIEPFLCLLHRRMTGLVLREPELRLVLSAYADDVLLVVQDPGDLAQVEACQAIYSAASSARVNWVKSSGLAVGDWQQLIEGILYRRTTILGERQIQQVVLPEKLKREVFKTLHMDMEHMGIERAVKPAGREVQMEGAKPGLEGNLPLETGAEKELTGGSLNRPGCYREKKTSRGMMYTGDTWDMGDVQCNEGEPGLHCTESQDPDHFDSDPQYSDLKESDQTLGTTEETDQTEENLNKLHWIGRQSETRLERCPEIVHQVLGTQQDSEEHLSGTIWNSGLPDARGAETGSLASAAMGRRAAESSWKHLKKGVACNI